MCIFLYSDCLEKQKRMAKELHEALEQHNTATAIKIMKEGYKIHENQAVKTKLTTTTNNLCVFFLGCHSIPSLCCSSWLLGNLQVSHSRV